MTYTTEQHDACIAQLRSNPAVKRVEVIGGQTLILGDCLEVMATLGRFDAVVTDPPYGTTQCPWDAVIPFGEMWDALAACVAADTPVLLFGCEPFSSLLRASNLRRFKYDWIWNKPKATGFLNAKKQPLRGHEIISVFYDRQCAYHPQKTKGARKQTFRGKHLQTDVYGEMRGDYAYDSDERYPNSVITFSSDTQNSSFHPTQKPVGLLEYLLKTYTLPGETVLDFTMGSGTTLVACQKLGRAGTGIEIDPDYFDIACRRVDEATRQPDMFVQQPPAATQEVLI
jgi:DNA modification methylase